MKKNKRTSFKNDTEYLLSNSENKKHLLEAVEQVKDGKIISFTEKGFDNFVDWIESEHGNAETVTADELRNMVKDGFFEDTK